MLKYFTGYPIAFPDRFPLADSHRGSSGLVSPGNAAFVGSYQASFHVPRDDLSYRRERYLENFTGQADPSMEPVPPPSFLDYRLREFNSAQRTVTGDSKTASAPDRSLA